MERHHGEEWHRADEAASAIGVTEAALHRRIDEGLVSAKNIGSDGYAPPHLHPADVEYMRREGVPYPTLERVEAGGAIEQPAEPLVIERDGHRCVCVATCVVRVGQTPAGPGRGTIGRHLPPELWRVLGPGDLVGDGEEENLDGALRAGDVVALPLDRGVLAQFELKGGP